MVGRGSEAGIGGIGQFSTVTGAITPANPAIQNLLVDDDDTAFAYQGIAGLSWRASDRWPAATGPCASSRRPRR